MKRIMALCLVLVAALAAAGFGFAKWSDNVSISASAETGKLSWGWVSNSNMMKDIGPDWHCLNGLLTVYQDEELKNVGNTTTSFEDTNNDGVLDKFNVDVNNAYPCYYNEISAKVQNYGTIPVIVQYAYLHWAGGTPFQLEDGVTYILNTNGQIYEYDGLRLPVAGEVLEFCWMNNAAQQQHPGEKFEESFEFHVLQPASQLTNYNFGISLEAIQWNESEIGPWQK